MNLASNEETCVKKMKMSVFRRRMLTPTLALAALIAISPLQAQQISLQALVTPSTTISKDGHPVLFAASRLHRI